jgi:hypothetical protein
LLGTSITLAREVVQKRLRGDRGPFIEMPAYDGGEAGVVPAV